MAHHHHSSAGPSPVSGGSARRRRLARIRLGGRWHGDRGVRARRRHHPPGVRHVLRLVRQHPAERRHRLPGDPPDGRRHRHLVETRSPTPVPPAETKAGTKIYVPRVGKYFIMEDDCAECDSDWTGHGPDGGPNLCHFDLWLGGKGGNAISAIECEDALTNYNPDNTPKLESVLVNPPSNETVSLGAAVQHRQRQLLRRRDSRLITVGQYQNQRHQPVPQRPRRQDHGRLDPRAWPPATARRASSSSSTARS